MKTLKKDSAWLALCSGHVFLVGGVVYLVDAEDYESIGTETSVGMALVAMAQVALHILPLLLFKGVYIVPSPFVVSSWLSSLLLVLWLEVCLNPRILVSV